MKQQNKVRKFWITKCPDCGGVDGSIEQVKSYDATRDLENWRNEERHISEYTQTKLGEFPYRCYCDILDNEDEEGDE